jgi:hypothetical protein
MADDAFTGHLRRVLERDAVVHRVTTAWLPRAAQRLCWAARGRWTGQIRTPARVIDLEGITAVWYRTPRANQFPSELSPAERGHATLEAKYGLGEVLSSLPALWVNHPSRLGRTYVILAADHDAHLG